MPLSVSKHGPKHAQAEAARAEAPNLERVSWWKEPGLRKLYFWSAVLMTMSASTGFDSWVSGSQPEGYTGRQPIWTCRDGLT
jgi:hypothetical protein